MPIDLHSRLEARGPLPFPEFMAWALYDPDSGYYADPGRTRIGREGDFITSVAIGPLFGRLLARRIHAAWTVHNRPRPFTLLEAGPEDGQLARDILAEAEALDPGFREALHYAAVEPMPRKREALAARLADLPRATVHAEASEVRGTWGAVLANEVLDALPVHLLTFTAGAWHERRVAPADDKGLALVPAAIEDDRLAAFCDRLGTRFPDPYHTEACLAYEPFLAPFAAAFDQALMILIDYGFPAAEYYHPGRSEGTLRTYRRHRATDDPLLDPGEQDITTHVNFTAVEEAARAAGFTPAGITPQEIYFTRLMAPLLPGLDPGGDDGKQVLQQFRTLTHPSFLGTRFLVAEFTKGIPPAPGA
ncbi:MAG: SAM-dependent methyltransferase [Akkermansiaceae bacterium]|nr:SAM-dependent methyltransferase [Akkermansiaceae bacterium]